MIILKKTSPKRPYTNTSALPVALVASVMLLGGCQTAPTLAPPLETSMQPPKLGAIATHEFPITKERNIVGGLGVISTQENDTLSDIARHFGLGYNDITLANRALSPWTPPANSRVLLPAQFILPAAPRKGIVLNLANMRMFYYPPKQPDTLFTYPVGIGRQGWSTPIGQTTIVAKKANPAWTVPASIQLEHAAKGDPLPKVVRSGPDNPLGNYAMPLGFSGYLIHGTNKPYGIGMQVSHGCVQLYPEDIEVLFNKATVGMPVRIVHQPYMTAWDGDMLYLEAHEPLKKWAGQKQQLQKSLLKQLRQSAAKKGATVDWDKVARILQRADGIPTPILADSPDVPQLAANAPELQHPEHFQGQPLVAELTNHDWAVLAADFDNEKMAQQLAAMLNHQGPPIPARKIAKDGSYQVIAGPFKNQKQAKLIAQRIKTDFEMDAKPLQPGSVMVE